MTHFETAARPAGRILVTAAFFLTAGWVNLYPLYGTRNPAAGALLLGLACLVATYGVNFPNDRDPRGGRWIPRLTDRIKRGLLPRRESWLAATVLCACFLAFARTATPMYRHLNAWLHELPFMTKAVGWVLQSLGADVAMSNEALFLSTDEDVIPVRVSMELLDLYWLMVFATALLVIRAICRPPGIKLVSECIGISAAYLFLRLAVLLLLFGNFPDFKNEQFPPRAFMFSEPVWRNLSYLPLAVVLAAVPGRRLLIRPDRIVWPVPGFERRQFASLAVTSGCAGILAALAVTWEDPGVRKGGRLLVDDWHSGAWEPADVPFGPETFGGMPLYSYSELLRLLRTTYSVSVHSRGELTPEELAATDVLVLKTPAKAFSKREISAVRDFIDRGGGVWAIGDHSDLLGMGTYFNALLAEDRIGFRFDSLNELSTGLFYVYHPDKLSRHFLLQGIPELEFLTSCSIKRPPFVGSVAVAGTDLIADPADYSQKNFFGRMLLSPQHAFGCFDLCVTKTRSQGRIAIFSDGTIFSNFCLFRGGHLPFARNTVEWLNRKNSWQQWLSGAFAILAALIAAVAMLSFRGYFHVRTIALSLGCALAAFVTAQTLVDQFNAARVRLPQPPAAPRRVCFPQFAGGFRMPPVIGVADPDPQNSYNSFFLCASRLQLVPSLDYDLDAALDAAPELVVVLNPFEKPPQGTIRKMIRYVADGGHLLVLDGKGNPSSTANQILAEFDLKLLPRSSEIEGGDAAFDDDYHELDVAVGGRAFGRGFVVAVLDSAFFSDESLGNAMAEPDDTQRRRYQLIMKLYRDCLAPTVRP